MLLAALSNNNSRDEKQELSLLDIRWRSVHTRPLPRVALASAPAEECEGSQQEKGGYTTNDTTNNRACVDV
jgi:hypothetical protein